MVAGISWERHFFLLLVSPWSCRYAEDQWCQGCRRTLGCSDDRCHGSLLEQDTVMRFPRPNHWLQATPGCPLLFILAQWPGVPEPKRWVVEPL